MCKWIPLFGWLVLGAAGVHSTEIDATVRADPASARAFASYYLKRGTEKYYQNEYAEALKDLEMAHELTPQDPAIISARGMAKSALKDFDGAHTDFKRALQLNPDLVGFFYNRGLARRRTGDFYGSVNDFDLVIALEPGHVDAYNSRANSKSELREYVDAFKDYTLALRLNPRFANAYMNRGGVSLMMGNYSAALIDLNLAVELQGGREPFSLMNRGLLYLDTKDYDRAMADFNRCTELKPGLAGPYAGRGAIAAIRFDLNEALQNLTRGIELEPEVSSYYLARAVVFEALNENVRAAADYQKAAGMDPGARSPEIKVYALLHWNLLARRTGGAGRSEHLSDREIGDYDWPSPIGTFLLGKRPATALLADAARRPWVVQQRGAECEALYFIAMDHLLEGRQDLAISFFQRCIDTGLESSREHFLAKIRMKELR